MTAYLRKLCVDEALRLPYTWTTYIKNFEIMTSQCDCGNYLLKATSVWESNLFVCRHIWSVARLTYRQQTRVCESFILRYFFLQE